MRVRLIAVGKMQADFAACEHRFRQRMRGPCTLEVVELADGRGKQSAQRKQEEARRILAVTSSNFILFDERGRGKSSMQWAQHCRQLAANAVQDFVIGGADGVSDEVRAQAVDCWSLSPLTLPHQMARLLVVEQLYCAWSIIQGHPYHRV